MKQTFRAQKLYLKNVFAQNVKKQEIVLLALWALVQPGSGSGSVSLLWNGSGVGAPSDTHCAKRPSLHPWDETHEDEVTEASKKKTVMVQHVNAITCKK